MNAKRNSGQNWKKKLADRLVGEKNRGVGVEVGGGGGEGGKEYRLRGVSTKLPNRGESAEGDASRKEIKRKMGSDLRINLQAGSKASKIGDVNSCADVRDRAGGSKNS